MKALYYGDNLEVMRRHIADGSVDLVYLDPPFNSARNYNAFFETQDGTRSAAQIQAFEDTWGWDAGSVAAYKEVLEHGGQLALTMEAFRTMLGENDMLAYLAMMAPRLVELRRVLKSTGSLYLHCDPTASHYLKLLLDAVFGPENFRNEITWKRTFNHGNAGRNYGKVCDVLFFYSKGDKYTWNQPFAPYSEEYIEGYFRYADPDGRRYRTVSLRNPSVRPNLHYPYTASNGITYQPHPNGWSCKLERMQEYDRDGRLYFPKKAEGALLLKQYLDEKEGVKLTNLWEDIPPLGAHAAERLGYPTQKPLALLERIIKAGSNEGDVVLDPFCGCGTAIDAAERLGRQWIGIDVTHLAIGAMKRRMVETYGTELGFKVYGEPTDVEGAYELAATDPYGFQLWSLGLVGARPAEVKKGADKGIDGRLTFFDGSGTNDARQIIISVKGGKLQAQYVRDLRGVLEREKAQMAVLISMWPPSKHMLTEAAAAGTWTSGWTGREYPRMEIITVEELMNGRHIDYPHVSGGNLSMKQAQRYQAPVETPPGLFD